MVQALRISLLESIGIRTVMLVKQTLTLISMDFLTDSSRKVVYPEDLVNYKTYEDGSAYPWVDYSGDNKTGDDSQGMIFNGKHYDEYFIVHADTFPKDKTEFTICLTIFRALQRMQNFGMVSNAVMTICDYDNPDGDKYEYDLSENRKL